jgi:hypothetical protein
MGGRNVSRVRAGVLAALLLACGLAGVAFPHANARFYRGDIKASGSWEGIIRLTGTVVIAEGVTVSIEPGTEVLVQPKVGADIVVRGRLLVRGVPSKPVRFDTAGGCAAGPWGGIVFERGSVGILENAVVHCAAKGISGDQAGVTRRGVTVQGGK